MASLASLYQLTGQILELQNALQDCDDQTIADTIEGSGVLDDIQAKAQNIIRLARSLEADAAVCEAEAARLSERAKASEKRAQALKDAVLRAMQAIGADKIKTELFTLTLAKNPPAVEITEPHLIPADFYVNKPQLDKQKIKSALTAGETVAGALLVQRKSLRVK